jgi:hypothetical protein
MNQRSRRAWAAVALGGLAAAVGEAAATFGSGGTAAYGAFCWGAWTCLCVLVSLPTLLGTLAPEGAGRPPLEVRIAALLLCGAAVLPVALLLAGRWGETISPELRMPVVVGGSLAVAGLALPAVPALAHGLSRLVGGRRLPVRWAGLLLLVLGAVAAWQLGERNRPIGLGISGIGLALLLPISAARWVGWLVPLALVAGGVGAWRLAHAPAATVRTPAEVALLTGVVLEQLEAASDDDDDGFGDAFGGLDCDDRDPFVHPAALDTPGNGLDENCRGGDAPKDFTRPKLPNPKKKLSDHLGPVPPHIVLLVLDAVRFDALGQGLTPNLDRWIARGTRFTRAFSTSSSTRHAVPALLSGVWVGHTEYQETVSLYTVDPKVHTLAEALAEKSYRTAAVMPPFVHGRLLGMGRGFRHFLSFGDAQALKAAEGRTAPLAVARALEILAEPYPFATFLLVHVDDAHAPYSVAGATREDDGTPKTRYLNEINRMDADLVPLLARLEALEAERPVLVAIVADHGEAFGEHGSFTHGRDLYQAVLHVPMVLVGQGIAPGTNDTPVDLLDLGVTLAQAGGARLRDAQGHTLWGLLTGEKASKVRPLFAEMRILHPPYPTWTAVVAWPLKLIERQDTGERMLFDLEQDPEELNDLKEIRPDDVSRLAGMLLGFAEQGTGPAGRFVPPAGPQSP